MLQLVLDGFTLLHSIYSIKEQLDDNQDGGKLLGQRVKVFETFFKDMEHYQGDILPSVQQSAEQLIDLLKEIKVYLEKFLKGGSLYQCGKRMVLNIAFRNTIASDLAGYNQRINDIAIILMPGIVLNVEARLQEELDAFCQQLNKSFSQFKLDLLAVKEDTKKMTILVNDFMKETLPHIK